MKRAAQGVVIPTRLYPQRHLVKKVSIMANAHRIACAKFIKDETGQVYGHLTVIERAPNPGSRGGAFWLCQCDCGNSFVAPGIGLRAGQNISCGCRKCSPTHGHSRRGSITPEYRCWKDMIARCHRPATKYFHNYGGRGIVVCDRWRHSFENFLADMGLRPSNRHSIDRKENGGNYEPANCRWATKQEQDNNRRTNRLLEVNGVSHTITEWARITGIAPVTIHYRIKRGWTIERAVMSPLIS